MDSAGSLVGSTTVVFMENLEEGGSSHNLLQGVNGLALTPPAILLRARECQTSPVLGLLKAPYLH